VKVEPHPDTLEFNSSASLLAASLAP